MSTNNSVSCGVGVSPALNMQFKCVTAYLEYEFADRSRVHIRTDGEVVRTPAPKYASDGRRINKGLRLDKDGSLSQNTR